MLERLSVRGLAIIDTVELELAAGFAALTGETGAGKSLLVESLKLLGGQRAQSDMVRTGDDRLRVEGVFTQVPSSALVDLLDELGAGDRDVVVLRREVTASGRSRCWINDVSVTASTLQRAAPHLLAIHGQHEQHGLADGGTQRRLVDEYGCHEALSEDTRARFVAWREAADELERLRAAQTSRRDRLDTITFQVQEIGSVEPRGGEDEELRRRRLVLQHAARLAELSSSLIDRLSDGEAAVVDGLAKAERDLSEIADCGLILDGGTQRLVEARVQIEEVVREVQGLIDESRGDPRELEEVESRLHILDQLMLKYGSTLDDVLAHREELMREREELESVEFMSAPGNARAGDQRLHGTVELKEGAPLTGYISWDVNEILTSDTLNGEESNGRRREILFGRIASIRPTRDGAEVTLADGERVELFGTDDVDDGNDGIQISDPGLGLVDVDWDEIERVRFHPPELSVGLESFDGGRRCVYLLFLLRLLYACCHRAQGRQSFQGNVPLLVGYRRCFWCSVGSFHRHGVHVRSVRCAP